MIQICKSAYVSNVLYRKPVIILYYMTQIKPILFYSILKKEKYSVQDENSFKI